MYDLPLSISYENEATLMHSRRIAYCCPSQGVENGKDLICLRVAKRLRPCYLRSGWKWSRGNNEFIPRE